MESYAKQSLSILSGSLAERIQPAVVFHDTYTIQKILAEYAEQYPIHSIQVIVTNGEVLSTIHHHQNALPFIQYLLDWLYFREPVTVEIQHQQQNFGQLVVYGNASTHVSFFYTILLALTISFILLLALLFWSANAVYRHLMKAVNPLVQTTQTISTNKNYQLRLPSSEISEFQEINRVVNELLDKIEASTRALQHENHQLSHQARHDGLTQLPNREYFHQMLAQSFAQGTQDSIALLFIDNDNFKEINDRHGHAAGDAVLLEMAKRLRQALNQHDFVSRLGGDEFAIIVKNIEDHHDLIRISENLLHCCRQPLIFNHHPIYFSFSIGIALAQSASSPEMLINNADMAMYKAKQLAQHWYIFAEHGRMAKG
ncbi:diguanylate cyclase [Acinetobacter indicus]|nr:diguanylate cyclase [Acinetobacter indicus]